jgi:acyl carrier protein
MMSNLEKYNAVFLSSFNIDENDLRNLTYQSVSGWDSVGHMNLVSLLEENFDIMFDTDDIIEFSSYEKGKEILKKYDVVI